MKRRVLCLLACLFLARPACAGEVREDEALVMRLAFDDCLGFVRHGRAPFEGLSTRPAPASVAREFPAAMAGVAQFAELLSPRYHAAWGEDASSRFCIIHTASEPWPPPGPGLLGVRPSGFTSRVTRRATAAGLTHYEGGKAFSPLVTTTWSEPGEDSGLGPRRRVHLVIMPSDVSTDKRLMDAGLIVMAGPPGGR